MAFRAFVSEEDLGAVGLVGGVGFLDDGKVFRGGLCVLVEQGFVVMESVVAAPTDRLEVFEGFVTEPIVGEVVDVVSGTATVGAFAETLGADHDLLAEFEPGD